ncbi:hypothetical protein STA1M1_09120 [Sinisalibacter aestuarii]|uniref:Uncharacterized protein n=1 Tax=Sinisalibacter aestuarii TaxID=2949426 RepID=A0ABQ5LQP8_9RHOB|nr:hypothetical protein STA1M1_09120 [Sinisalibacter aestuarii]
MLATYTRLNGAVEILGIDLQYPVHLRQVDADAAADGVHIPLKRGAGPEGNDGQLVLRADPDCSGHVLGTSCKNDKIGRRPGMKGFIVCVLVEDRLRCNGTILKMRLYRVEAGLV